MTRIHKYINLGTEEKKINGNKFRNFIYIYVCVCVCIYYIYLYINNINAYIDISDISLPLLYVFMIMIY